MITVGYNSGDLCFLDSRYKITFKTIYLHV